ncbi:MAG: branched-chain amino acid transport system ATP-binding protein livM [Bradyrhizobium sp.]|jgi:branched-chain amino acid transport system ATP-binding protein|nr:branched-chain amino acid transport system ATP-binding protein livM [Bradyrhizobium sp.]
MTAEMLSVRGLSIRFGRMTIVENVDISCASGSVTVLTGANGSGKTTALNALNGLARRRAGRIAIDGRDVPFSWTPYQAFAYGVRRTFQVPRNWPSLDVAENVGIASDRGAAAIAEQIRRCLAGVAKDRAPATLSLGQRRMLELSRLLLARGECKVALLDEPLSGLDADNAARVYAAVEQLRRTGAAVLIVDHEPRNWPGRDATIQLDVPPLSRDRNGPH